MSWAGGFTINLTEPYQVREGDRYVIDFDVFDTADPDITARPAKEDDMPERVLTAQSDGVVTQVRVELR
jgi:hypothetical protein